MLCFLRRSEIDVGTSEHLGMAPIFLIFTHNSFDESNR